MKMKCFEYCRLTTRNDFSEGTQNPDSSELWPGHQYGYNTITAPLSTVQVIFLYHSHRAEFLLTQQENSRISRSQPVAAAPLLKSQHTRIISCILSNNPFQCAFSDPFADAFKGSEDDVQDGLVHIRIQQRNGRKTLTTVQGLSSEYDLKKIVRACKKEFACNGTVIEHPEYGEVLQLQGDQRENICQWLTKTGLAKPEQLKVHGF
ncbi:uncharacterized protein LOC103522001 [Diaphorina citri]|uniref:Eukaryotic translation initiation factor eIF1 n=1 Tax=Diaphorina citri TaxID=121845 RepID=A0A1S3DNH8_DIACI|nr:uncharacterized protein LOC103522001 [Diaphorina citri]